MRLIDACGILIAPENTGEVDYRMRRRMKRIARALRKISVATEVLPLTAKSILTTLTIPTLLSGCASQTTGETLQASAAPVTKKVYFHTRRSSASNPSIGAFDGGSMQAIDLPPSDYLIVEEIVSRRARIAEQERLAREQARAQLEQEPIGRSTKRRDTGAGRVRVRSNGRIVDRLRTGKSVVAQGEQTPTAPLEHPWIGRPGREGLWQLVRANLKLSGVTHERVEAQLEEFRRHPGRVTYLAARAEPYLPHIVGEIGRRGLPADLVLVPMVESAFQPNAVSPKAAAGLWQIIPSTGIEHGLTVSDTYDGRFDVQASTRAALSYFRQLIGMFRGDWLLALAAYNCGEGAVQRAIAANQKAGKGTSFWDLELPAETRAYVPKIVALARVFGDPESFGLKIRKAEQSPGLAAVQLAAGIRLVDAVAASGLTADEFFRLNPAFRADAEPPVQGYSVMLPVEKAKSLAASLPGSKFLGTQTVVVRRGDTLATIARRHGVAKLQLAQWNGLTPDTPLVPGQELLVFSV